MKYYGLQSQITKNNVNSVLLLLMFPLVFYALAWLFFLIMSFGVENKEMGLAFVNRSFLSVVPWISIGVAVWFAIAWFSHTAIINNATN